MARSPSANKRSVVHRALTLLSALDMDGRTLTELARSSDLSLPTALRLLRSLENDGYASRSAGKYYPGEATIRLAHSADPHGPVRTLVREGVQRLRDRLNETVNFQVRQGSERMCIESAEGAQPLRHLSRGGDREVLYRGAPGKVLLAFGSNVDLDRLVPLSKGTYEVGQGQRRSLSELRDELEKIRRLGYAVSKGESKQDFAGVAVPVHFGDVFIGVLSVGWPYVRFNKQVCDSFTKACLEEAERIHARAKVSEPLPRAAKMKSSATKKKVSKSRSN